MKIAKIRILLLGILSVMLFCGISMKRIFCTPDISLLRERAMQGDWKAQETLRSCYMQGLGCKASSAEAETYAASLKNLYHDALQEGNDTVALELWQALRRVDRQFPYADDISWLSNAVERGHAEALWLFVNLRAEGTGLGAQSADFQRQQAAMKQFVSSAEAGNAEMQYRLSHVYWEGIGVTKCSQKAADWCLKAARQGHPKACLLLCELYREGKGVPVSSDESDKWHAAFYRATLSSAEKGDAEAQMHMALLSNGNMFFQKWRALHWAKLAIEQGYAPAVPVWYLIKNGIIPLSL